MREITIPAITDPLGRHWQQPSPDEILIDTTHALMSEVTFNQLLDYSQSQPSAVYAGKMWKCFSDGRWFLCWFGESLKGPNYCSNNFAEILIER